LYEIKSNKINNNNIAIENEITIEELFEFILLSIYYINIDKIIILKYIFLIY